MQNDEATARPTHLNNCDPKCWVSKYAEYLYAFAIIRLNDEDLAKDLVQDTFLAALEGISAFAGRSSEKTWLTSILKNKIYAIYRIKSTAPSKKMHIVKDHNNGFFEELDGHWLVEQRPKEFGIEDPACIENKELKRMLEDCIKKLPSLWLSIFAMKHLEDMSTEIVCKTFNVTPANFWVIMHRAKLNLRACLQKTGL